MAELKFTDKVRVFIAENGIIIVGVLVAAVAYLVFKMKKRNVKIFGR